MAALLCIGGCDTAAAIVSAPFWVPAYVIGSTLGWPASGGGGRAGSLPDDSIVLVDHGHGRTTTEIIIW